MTLSKKTLAILPVLIGILVLVLAASGKNTPTRLQPTETVTVARVTTADPQAFIPRITGFGTVAPSRTVDLIAQVSARVVQVGEGLKRGAFVSKGDVLATLSAEDFELEIAEAGSEIASAEVNLEELAVGLQAQQKSLEIAKAVLDLEVLELNRFKTLLDRKVISDQQVENQQAAVLQQETAVQNLRNEIALNPVKRKALEQARRKSELRLETARLGHARTVIRAPFDARVARVDIEIGKFVAAGTSIGELDGTEAASIDVQLNPVSMSQFAGLLFEGRPEADAGLRNLGRELERISAVVRIGSSGAWPATVKRISDTVDPETRSLGLIVGVDNPYDDARPGTRTPLVKGMFATVELAGPEIADRSIVPRNAVVNGKIKIVSQNNRLAFADAQIAFQHGDVVVLRSALPAGTRVVVSDLSPAIEGMLLRPVEDNLPSRDNLSSTGNADKTRSAAR
ncbi:MAG: HlyD family efflux transporter periplasmic adaptor subunit [Hyphomicrobiales bacterium]|uniref:efflux RND transporter periplasmic adaptor subunit n=1 Tax=Alphaproteobacteria TaxID=28211 RepID=UPI0032657954